MRKFEYNILRITNTADLPTLIKQLDTSGQSGWELISAIPIANNMIQLYFKREIFDTNNEEVL